MTRTPQTTHLAPKRDFHLLPVTFKPDSFGWNDHGYFEVALCLGGRGAHKTLSGKDSVRKGTVVLMNHREPHTWVVAESLDLLFLQWKDVFLTPILAGISKVSRLPPLRRRLEGKDGGYQVLSLSAKNWGDIYGMADLLTRAHRVSGESEECRCLLGALLARLDRAAESPLGRRIPESTREDLVDKVLTYLQGHFASPHTVADLSRRVGLSPDHFTRRFKQRTGYHLGEYIHDLRTREACRLLSEDHLTVTETAERVGYRHAAHFIRSFQKITGSSPLRWRETQG